MNICDNTIDDAVKNLSSEFPVGLKMDKLITRQAAGA